MKKVGKTIGFIYLILLVLIFVCSFVIIYGVCNTRTTIFQNKYYNSIEELHNDYVKNLDKAYDNGESMTDYYPKSIVDYFEYNNDVFVVCTYSSLIDGEIKDDSLFVYIVKNDDNGYYLEIPHFGLSSIYSALVPLHDDYDSFEYKSKIYTEYKNSTYKLCYGFAYKEVDEDYELYFDDIRMNEIKITNPFTEEKFMLCYAVSDKTYNFVEMLFTPRDKRHTLLIK